MLKPVENFSGLLRQAVAGARASGLNWLAREVETSASAAYTTSSEYLGEVGQASIAFLRAGGPAVPPSVAGKLHACPAQINRVWPELRP